MVSVAPAPPLFSGWLPEDISRVDTPRIRQGFSRIGVGVSCVLSDVRLRTISRTTAKHHDSSFGARDYSTGGAGFSNGFHTAGSRYRTTAKPRSL